jgi:class 3 adenylate cyclase/tetratricopeptide (TPR) repeat protein
MEEGLPRRDEERRYATVLFADVSGFTAMSEKMDPEDVTVLMNRCFALLEAAVRRYGGTVDKYIGDCVMAVFGVPVALEETPRSAVNAAIEMRKAIYDLNGRRPGPVKLDIHTGINTGLVLAGDVGGAVKRDFTVMGDTVNLASRLKDASPHGAIWVGSETYRHTRDAFEYRVLKPLQLKGKDRPVPIYEVLSKHETPYRVEGAVRRRLTSRLVGRDEEIGELSGAVAAVVEGRGGVVSLIGEAGLGKTRLVRELCSGPESANATILQGRSLSVGQRLSFHPFCDLLRDWAVVSEDQPAAELVARLDVSIRRLFGDETSEVLPFVATMMGAPLAGAARTRVEGITGEALDRLVRKNVRDLFTRIATVSPLILVLEDLHWADESSIGLLESLLGLTRAHPILFVNISRPSFAETSERILQASRRLPPETHTEIHLQPLNLRDSRSFIDNLFPRGDLPATIRGDIQGRAGGNPFYLEEVIRSLIDEGAVTHVDRALCVTDKIHAVSIPGTIREVIMTRIDRLKDRERTVFQIAAVIGRSFDYDILVELVPDRERLDEDLDRLVGLELLVREHGYSFKHALIQEVAYDSILRATREKLHGRVAEVIEVKHALIQEVGYAGIPSGARAEMHGMVAEVLETKRGVGCGVAAQLAYHFSLAGQTERAETYLFEAGDEAARSSASNEALYFFREASRLYLATHGDGADPRRQALLQKNIALALFNRGQLIEAGQHFTQAIECLGEKLPHRQMAIVMRFAQALVVVMWRIHVSSGRRHRAPATDTDRELIDIMFHRAQAQTTADPARFLFDTMENLRKLDSVDPRTVPNAGGMYASVVGIFSYGGISFRVGERFLRRAAPLVARNDAREVLLFRLMSYLHHLLAGSWSEEHTIDEPLIEQNLRLGELWTVTSYLGLETEQRIRQGRFAAAHARLTQLRTIEDAYGSDLAKSNRQAMTALLHLERRELPRALDAAEAYYAEHQDKLFNVYALGILAKIHVQMGRLDEAERALERAAEIVKRAGRVPPFHLSNCLRSRLLLEVAKLDAGTGSPAGATKAARAALRLARRVAWQRPEVYGLTGTVHWLRGRRRAALRMWGRSLAEGERLETMPELARTYGEIGRRLAQSSDVTIADLSPAGCVEKGRELLSRLGLGEERPAHATLPGGMG